MGHKKGKPLTKAEREQKRRASMNSPWRQPYDLHSKRQRQCWEHFQALAAEGDTARKPRPELDEDG